MSEKVANVRHAGGLVAVGLLSGWMVPGIASAGVPGATIRFGPQAQAVPTLGGVALVLLATLFAFIALRVLHRRQGGKGTAVLLAGILTTGAIATGGGGIKLLGETFAQAQTTTVPIADMDLQGGIFEFRVLDDGSINEFRNDSSVPVVVLSIEPDFEICAVDGTCQEGLVLPVGETCTASASCNEELIVIPPDDSIF